MAIPRNMLLDFFKSYTDGKMDREKLQDVLSFITQYNPFVEIDKDSVYAKVVDMSQHYTGRNIAAGQFIRENGRNYIYLNEKFLEVAVQSKAFLINMLITIGHEYTHFVQNVVDDYFDFFKSNKKLQYLIDENAGKVIKSLNEYNVTTEELKNIYDLLRSHLSPFYTKKIQDMSQDEREKMFSALEYAFYFQKSSEVQAEMSGISFAVNIFDYVCQETDDLDVKNFCIDALEYLEKYKENFVKTYNDTLEKIKVFDKELVKIDHKDLIELGNEILFDENIGRELKKAGVYANCSRSVIFRRAMELYADSLTPHKCEELYKIGLKTSCPTFFLPMLDSLKFRLPKKEYDRVLKETIDILATDKTLNRQAFCEELYEHLDIDNCIELSKKYLKNGRIVEQCSLFKSIISPPFRFTKEEVAKYLTEILPPLKKDISSAFKNYKKDVYDENYLTLENAYQQFISIRGLILPNIKNLLSDKVKYFYYSCDEELCDWENIRTYLVPSPEESYKILKNIYGETYAEYEKEFEEVKLKKFDDAMKDEAENKQPAKIETLLQLK